MNKLRFGIALRTSLSAKKSNICPIILSTRRYSSRDDDKPESEKSNASKKNVTEKDAKTELILNKLNSLLMEMGTSKDSPLTLKLSKPVPKRGIKTTEKVSAEIEQETPKEDPVVKAAKEVAESLGGDTKQTESELMKKLLNPTEEDNTASISSLSEIFKGMKIDRSQPQVEQQSRAMQVKKIMGQNKQQQENVFPARRFKFRPQNIRKPQELKLDNINLFGSEPLGIFTADLNECTEGVKNKTWDTLKQREMKLAVTHPPSNYFQQLILWTEQGKLWKFPIDNEQGLEEEQNVSFADHIFLEKHLEPWCPPKGPIRHFMELVCVGLSKNCHLTVEAKKEHIAWYKNYFEDKRQLLREVGAALNEVEPVKKIEAK